MLTSNVKSGDHQTGQEELLSQMQPVQMLDDLHVKMFPGFGWDREAEPQRSAGSKQSSLASGGNSGKIS